MYIGDWEVTSSFLSLEVFKAQEEKRKEERARGLGRLGKRDTYRVFLLDLLDLWLAGWMVDISRYCSRREERSLGVSVSMSGEGKPFFSGTFAGENWKTRRR